MVSAVTIFRSDDIKRFINRLEEMVDWLYRWEKINNKND